MSADTLVLDSSCWIAWLDDTDARGDLVDQVVGGVDGRIAVPSIVVYEVERWTRRNHVDDARRRGILAQLKREQELPIDTRTALRAAAIARVHRLGMADALIAGSASIAGFALATFDPDFEGVPGVTVLATPA